MKDLIKKDFEKLENILREKQKQLFEFNQKTVKELEFFGESKYFKDILKKNIFNVFKNGFEEEENSPFRKELIEVLNSKNINFKDFLKNIWDYCYYRIEEYKITKRFYNSEDLIRIHTKIYFKEDNSYMYSYDLDYDLNYNIEDDRFFY